MDLPEEIMMIMARQNDGIIAPAFRLSTRRLSFNAKSEAETDAYADALCRDRRHLTADNRQKPASLASDVEELGCFRGIFGIGIRGFLTLKKAFYSLYHAFCVDNHRHST